MLYYRVAYKSNLSDIWQWKSTKLTSTEALFRLLRSYRAVSQDRFHVFTAATSDELDEQLDQLNKTEAEIFQYGPEVPPKEIEEGAPSLVRGEQAKISNLSYVPYFDDMASIGDTTRRVLERRRLDLEEGEGGDHDEPYVFSMPVTIQVRLAWTRLLGKVQRSELEG